MNFHSAFNINNVNPSIYRHNVIYSSKCIYCDNIDTNSLINGGILRRCNKCRRNFKPNILSDAVSNYAYSTSHLKSTH